MTIEKEAAVKERERSRHTLKHYTEKFSNQLREGRTASEKESGRLRSERDTARLKVASLEAKQIEVESFLNSRSGTLAKKLETQLCETNLKLAIMMEERDDLEMLVKRAGGKGLGRRNVMKDITNNK